MPEQSTPVAPAEQQIIQHSVQYLQKYLQETYGSVKAMTPAVVQSSLQTIEDMQAVNTLTGQLQTVSQPLITSLDQRLVGVMQNLEISNLSDLKSKLKEDLSVSNLKSKAAILTEDLTTRAAGIKTDLETRVSDIKTDIETRVQNAKTGLETKAVEWKSVRGDLSKKTIQRLEEGLSSVKQFTSEQSEALLHVDLIKYASDVIDNAQATVKPTFDVRIEKGAAGIITVNKSISNFQDMAVQKSRQSLEQAEAFRAELRARLSKAIAASRELSHHSAEFVLVYYQKIKNLDREQVKATYNESVQYILEAPALFTKLAHRLDQLGTDLTSVSAVESINRLLASLREVVGPQQKSEADKKVAEQTATETKECKEQPDEKAN
jgi:hypothetical protein